MHRYLNLSKEQSDLNAVIDKRKKKLLSHFQCRHQAVIVFTEIQKSASACFLTHAVSLRWCYSTH